MLRWIRARLSRENGVSLVETLVAMLIVGFVLMALASTTTASLAAMRGNERHTRGTHYGNQLVEQMHSIAWSDLTLYASDCPAPAGRPPCPAGLTASPPTFEGRPVVMSTATPPAGRLLPTETLTTGAPEGAVAYTVTRIITWVDDPCDGYASPAPVPAEPCKEGGVPPAAGTDDDPKDYRRLTAVLSWTAEGQPRSQRFDSNRVPPLDGPTATTPFRITKVDILPSRTITLNASKQSTSGAVTIEVTVSRPASSVSIRYAPAGTTTWTVLPTTSTDQLVWRATIAANHVWDPEGYWDLRIGGCSTAVTPCPDPTTAAFDALPVNERSRYEERLWVSQTPEKFVAVTGFTVSPANRLDRFHHNNNPNHQSNNNTNCAAVLQWTATKSDPADTITTNAFAITYWANGSVAMNWWLLPKVLTGSTPTSASYATSIPQNTKLTGDRIVFVAYASNPAGDSDIVTRERPMTHNQSCA